MNIKKIAKLAVFTVLMGGDLVALAQSKKEWAYMYSHTFGEPNGKGNGPTYPDAPARIFSACFYTKPSVHVWANYAKKLVDKGANAINLNTKSCGAGIAVNGLAKLHDYDSAYWAGSNIRSKEDASKVFDALNNGLWNLNVPLFDLRKARAMTLLGSGLSKATIGAACWKAYSLGVFSVAPYVAVPLAIAAAVAANYVAGPLLKKAWINMLDLSMFVVTRGNYNPFHIRPIEAALKLRKKLTCPILISQCQHDGLLENPDKSTLKFYEALRDGHEHNTHFLLIEDAGHNSFSKKELEVRNAFWIKYDYDEVITYTDKKGNIRGVPRDVEDALKGTQPTLDELRNRIFPSSMMEEE